MAARKFLVGEAYEWEERANCRNDDPAKFFPEHQNHRAREAKQVCQACTVRAECLREALESGREYGVWGGLTERERRDLLRRRR